MQSCKKNILSLSGKAFLKDVHLHLDADKNHTKARKGFHIEIARLKNKDTWSQVSLDRK